jgi:hypothetical protein
MSNKKPPAKAMAYQPAESRLTEDEVRELEEKFLSQARLSNLKNETLIMNGDEQRARYWEGRSEAFQDAVAAVRALAPRTAKPAPIPVNTPMCERCGKNFLECQCQQIHPVAKPASDKPEAKGGDG